MIVIGRIDVFLGECDKKAELEAIERQIAYRGKVLTLLTLLITNYLTHYTTPYIF